MLSALWHHGFEIPRANEPERERERGERREERGERRQEGVESREGKRERDATICIYIYVYMSIKERIDQNSEIQGRHETFERNSSLQVYENAIVQKRQENVATLGGVG